MSHVDRAHNPGSTKPNAAFNSEVRAAAFLQLDRFIVLASGAKVFLYKYVPHTQPRSGRVGCRLRGLHRVSEKALECETNRLILKLA